MKKEAKVTNYEYVRPLYIKSAEITNDNGNQLKIVLEDEDKHTYTLITYGLKGEDNRIPFYSFRDHVTGLTEELLSHLDQCKK